MLRKKCWYKESKLKCWSTAGKLLNSVKWLNVSYRLSEMQNTRQWEEVFININIELS